MTRCPRCEAVDARPSARFCARCGHRFAELNYHDYMAKRLGEFSYASTATDEPYVRFETERPRDTLFWPVAAYLVYAAIAVSLLIWLYG